MSPKRSDEFKADRREEILVAAMHLFVTRGYDRTTMREIAREAGVSTGAIYVYYPTKAAMLQAVCADEAARMHAILQTTLHDLPADADLLAAGMMAFVGRFGNLSPGERQRRERIGLMLRYEATRDDAVGESVRAVIASWRALVVAIIRAQQESGRIRADVDVAALTEMLLALPQGLELVELSSGTATDWPTVVGTLADVLWHGLAPVRPRPESAG
ncbi:MAG: Transcriptional regulator, AcrR family [uncultured Thermomicrobiales bacterium]|uniref:Transcriptional regulator, AcrR family n=1 Tax=uncultured Thermomicrobiales bacterium TaxID=1645740 RepID=A0A6J4VWN9_9BACT|nr:MAG: Transcriptional regulator, AcrR family [uncultured Thermomicrobiales bacterium]